jgi:hypothetical protein
MCMRSLSRILCPENELWKRTNPEPDFACSSLPHAVETPGVAVSILHHNHCVKLAASTKHAVPLFLHSWNDTWHVALRAVSQA